MASSGRRPIETRVGVGGVLLLSAYLGVLAAIVPMSPIPGPDGDSQPANLAASRPVPADLAPGATASAAPRIGANSAGADRYPKQAALSQTPAGPTGSQPTSTVPPKAAPSPMPSSTPISLASPDPVRQARSTTADPNRIYRVPILMYHRVVPDSEAGDSAPGLMVTPAAFSAQLKAFYLANWHSITMATLADEMEADTTIPPKTFVITFDDGWSDGYYYAFPIMREYGFVGTFFVISARIDRPGALSTWQMRALEAAGNEIGNHTENHTSLSTVSGSRVVSEVETASEEIAHAVGHQPVSLSYPMGGVSTYVALLVSQIPDIKIAVTTRYGRNETWFGRYDTPRVRINPTTDPTRLLDSLSR